MKENITLDELRTLICLHESGSICKASDVMGVMPSTISRSLTRLEEKLSASLVVRNTRRVEFTAEGSKLVEHANNIIHSVNSIKREFSDDRDSPSGTLRINGASPVLIHLISPILKRYLKQYPNVHVELHNNEEIIDLIEYRADIAIRVGPVTDATFDSIPLGASKRRLVASPGYLRENGFPQSIEDLNDHTLIGLEGPSSLNTWPVKNAENKRLKIQPAVVASSGEVVRQLTVSGTGIACITDFISKTDCGKGRLIEVLADHNLNEEREIHAVFYRGKNLSPKVASFIEFLKQEIQHKL